MNEDKILKIGQNDGATWIREYEGNDPEICLGNPNGWSDALISAIGREEAEELFWVAEHELTAALEIYEKGCEAGAKAQLGEMQEIK